MSVEAEFSEGSPDEFPSYAFVPGYWPHPSRHPEGHSYGQVEPKVSEPLTAGNLSSNPGLSRGIRLFDAGYYWEAHEEWESLWHLAERDSPEWRFLKGLILLAAGSVKIRQGNLRAAKSLGNRGLGLIQTSAEYFGPSININVVLELVAALGVRELGQPRKPVEVLWSQSLAKAIA